MPDEQVQDLAEKLYVQALKEQGIELPALLAKRLAVAAKLQLETPPSLLKAAKEKAAPHYGFVSPDPQNPATWDNIATFKSSDGTVSTIKGKTIAFPDIGHISDEDIKPSPYLGPVKSVDYLGELWNLDESVAAAPMQWLNDGIISDQIKQNVVSSSKLKKLSKALHDTTAAQNSFVKYWEEQPEPEKDKEKAAAIVAGFVDKMDEQSQINMPETSKIKSDVEKLLEKKPPKDQQNEWESWKQAVKAGLEENKAKGSALTWNPETFSWGASTPSDNVVAPNSGGYVDLDNALIPITGSYANTIYSPHPHPSLYIKNSQGQVTTDVKKAAGMFILYKSAILQMKPALPNPGLADFLAHPFIKNQMVQCFIDFINQQPGWSPISEPFEWEAGSPPAYSGKVQYKFFFWAAKLVPPEGIQG